MKHIIFAALFLLVGSCAANAQSTIKIIVQNSKTKESLSAATAKLMPFNKTIIADSLGIIVFEKVPNGAYTLYISYVGCIDQTINITTPLLMGHLKLVILKIHQVFCVDQVKRTLEFK